MNTAMGTLVMEPPSIYKAVAPPDAAITGRIHHIRGQKVMLDRDLAELYGVQVKALKQAVRRNMERFPEDFLFELTIEEAEASRSQTVTLNMPDASRSQNATLRRGQNIKYLPYAFTEHGILMLANVLRSEQAIAVSTCLPAGRFTLSASSTGYAKCFFRTARSSRSWNNLKVASPVTTRRSRPSSITSRNWSHQRSRHVSPSASSRKVHDPTSCLLNNSQLRQRPTCPTAPHKTVLQPS